MQTISPYIKLALLCLTVSFLAHGVYLYEWSQDRFMAGINDGLSQMLPFKQLLYSQYTSGEFFYTTILGLGSGTFGGLAYYFSTSIVFLLTTGFFYILETFGVISHPDVLFWAHAAVFISTIRLACILGIAFFVFRYFGFDSVPAFLGASVYGLTSIYFRHTVYWEFFADAFLWLPLLILGAEKILRENRPFWFLFAVALSMFDNFYFAYVNFLVTGIYIGFRFFIPFSDSEVPKRKAVFTFLWSGLIGAGISAVSFIPAVYAYLNNYRPPYRQSIEWFDLIDNVLFTSSFIVLPGVFVIFLYAFPLYKDKKFRFFVCLVLFGLLLHFSPKAASVFNGFSAPQYRWEYFLSFAAGGAIAAGFSRLSLLSIKQMATAGGLALLTYGLYAYLDPRFAMPASVLGLATVLTILILSVFAWMVFKNSLIGQSVAFAGTIILSIGFLTFQMANGGNINDRTATFLLILGAALFVFIILIRSTSYPSATRLAAFFIVLSLIASVNSFQSKALVKSGSTHLVTEELITGPDYNDIEILGLLDQIEEYETNPVYRVDWMEGVRNNTSIVQGYRGVNAYSSILNKELLFFYLYDLEIDMGRESVSRYATLGKRANLHSILQADYVITEANNPNVPFDFEAFAASDNYVVYENQNKLPFVRSASDVYSEESLDSEPVLTREHAMLSGVVLKEKTDTASLPATPEQQGFSIQEAGAAFKNGVLTVTEETGGIDLVMEQAAKSGSDFYVSFHLVNQARDAGFPLTVNDYRTTRKSNSSIYKTHVDDLTIRIPADNTVRIRVPEGTYELTELTVHEEPYDILRAEAAAEPVSENVVWEGSRIEATYQNTDDGRYLVMPVPYEIGWSAKVNGESVEVLEANYAFIAVPASAGTNVIELTYRPPYFYSSLVLSLVSSLAAVFYIRKRRRRTDF